MWFGRKEMYSLDELMKREEIERERERVLMFIAWSVNHSCNMKAYNIHSIHSSIHFMVSLVCDTIEHESYINPHKDDDSDDGIGKLKTKMIIMTQVKIEKSVLLNTSDTFEEYFATKLIFCITFSSTELICTTWEEKSNLTWPNPTSFSVILTIISIMIL